jgi:hypothetical protein
MIPNMPWMFFNVSGARMLGSCRLARAPAALRRCRSRARPRPILGPAGALILWPREAGRVEPLHVAAAGIWRRIDTPDAGAKHMLLAACVGGVIGRSARPFCSDYAVSYSMGWFRLSVFSAYDTSF